MKKKILVRAILAVWIVIWALFLIRPYFKKHLLGEYFTLLTLSAEGKRAHIMGEDLHRFINFCEGSIPKPFTYKVVGITGDSIENRRARYYLYPNMEDRDPGYKIFKTLDSERYILKKAR